jgi:hypothetical protein
VDAATILKEWGPIATGVSVGGLGWLKAWADARHGRGQQRIDLIKIAQEAAGEVIEELRAEIARLRSEIAALERELMEARREHADVLAAKEARLLLLEGEIRHWMQIADTYERQLTEAGVPHEKPAQPIWRVPRSEAANPL